MWRLQDHEVHYLSWQPTLTDLSTTEQVEGKQQPYNRDKSADPYPQNCIKLEQLYSFYSKRKTEYAMIKEEKKTNPPVIVVSFSEEVAVEIQ